MAGNPFDQFDQVTPKRNPFDQFDQDRERESAQQSQPVQQAEGDIDWLGGRWAGIKASAQNAAGSLATEVAAPYQNVMSRISGKDPSEIDISIGGANLSQFARERFSEGGEQRKIQQQNTPEGAVSGFATEAVDAIINMAPAIATTYVTRSGNAGLAVLGSQVFSDTYGQEIEAGKSREDAVKEAAIQVAFELGPEKAFGFFDNIPGAAGIKMWLKQSLTEGVSEMATEGLNIYDEHARKGGDVGGPVEIAGRTLKAGAMGAVVGGVLTVPTAMRKPSVDQTLDQNPQGGGLDMHTNQQVNPPAAPQPMDLNQTPEYLETEDGQRHPPDLSNPFDRFDQAPAPIDPASPENVVPPVAQRPEPVEDIDPVDMDDDAYDAWRGKIEKEGLDEINQKRDKYKPRDGKTWRETVNPAKDSFLILLAKRGGLDADAFESQGLDVKGMKAAKDTAFNNNQIPGFPVIRGKGKGGLTPDDVAEIVMELAAGGDFVVPREILDEHGRTTINHVVDAIMDELRGDPVIFSQAKLDLDAEEALLKEYLADMDWHRDRAKLDKEIGADNLAILKDIESKPTHEKEFYNPDWDVASQTLADWIDDAIEAGVTEQEIAAAMDDKQPVADRVRALNTLIEAKHDEKFNEELKAAFLSGNFEPRPAETKGRPQAEAPRPQELEPAQTVAGPILVTWGDHVYEVESTEEAQELWNEFRDTSGAGASEIGSAEVTDLDGNRLGKIAYNGQFVPGNAIENKGSKGSRIKKLESDISLWQSQLGRSSEVDAHYNEKIEKALAEIDSLKPAKDAADLLGQNTTTEQTKADTQRQKDEKRSGKPGVETVPVEAGAGELFAGPRPPDLFSQEQQSAAPNITKSETELPEGLDPDATISIETPEGPQTLFVDEAVERLESINSPENAELPADERALVDAEAKAIMAALHKLAKPTAPTATKTETELPGEYVLAGKWSGAKQAGLTQKTAEIYAKKERSKHPENKYEVVPEKNYPGKYYVARYEKKAQKPDLAVDVDAAANEAATSPKNNLPAPTEAQIEAGNYKKGQLNLHGFQISVENPKGSFRSGKGWKVRMADHYGYIKGTEGGDGEHLDVFLGPRAKDANPLVAVVDQRNKDGSFDESKVIIGYKPGEAEETYFRNYSKDFKNLGVFAGLSEITLDDLKDWIKNGDLTKPYNSETFAKEKENVIPRQEDGTERQSGQDGRSQDQSQAGQQSPHGATDQTGRREDAQSGQVAKPEKGAKAPLTGGEVIEDFGETIAGARKEIAAYQDKMKQAVTLEIAAHPLSKTWPLPDYQKLIEDGADPWIVGFIRAARDSVPHKPRDGWKLSGWVSKVEQLRGFSEMLLSGEYTKEEIAEKLEIEQYRRLRDEMLPTVELYEAVGHGQSLKGVRVTVGRYSVHKGVELDPPKTIWSVSQKAKATAFSNWPRTLAEGATKDEAIKNFKKAVEAGVMDQKNQKAAKKKSRFGIWSKRNQPGFYYVGTKIGRHIAKLKEFSTVQEARKFLASEEGNAEAESLLKKYKEIPSERRGTNSPRIGADHRNGGNVTPEQFQEAFGFRGVQFGNYVEQGKRQQDLNKTYDALMDLAGVLDIPAKALSLNGELGLAFGARGKGGKDAPAAHYEAGHIVINLTKREGAGSLAHEWWHGLDNYFSRMRGKPAEFLTETAERPGEGVRPEMVAAFKNVMKTVNQTALRERSKKLDSRRAKEYWTTGLEMTARAFESYVITKLDDVSVSNDYLANIIDEQTWEVSTQMGMELEGSYPYPIAAEIPAIRGAYDAFFEAVETKETEQGIALFSRSEGTKGGYENRIDEIFAGNANTRSTIRVLDESDVLGMLGYEGLPVVVRESKVDDARFDHRLTAEHWKKIPEWLENPLAVFDSDTVPGSLLFIAPETLNGYPISIAIRPNKEGLEAHLVASAYERRTQTPFRRWMENGLLRYHQAKEKPPSDGTERLRLPKVNTHLGRGQKSKVLSEKDLVKYRDQRLDFSAARAETIDIGFRTSPRATTEGRSTFLTKQLESAIGLFLGRSISPGTYQQVSTPKSEAAAVKVVERVFGKRVVFFKQTKPVGMRFNGVLLPRDPKTLYINIDSTNPYMGVVGHELLHALRIQHPELYDQLSDLARKHLKTTGFAEFANKLDAQISKNTGDQRLTDDKMFEEMVANVNGEAFLDPKFISALAAQDQNFLQRLITAIVDILKSFQAKLKGRGMGSSKYFNDIQGLIDQVQAVLKTASTKQTSTNKGQSAAPEFSDQLPMDEASRKRRAKEMGFNKAGFHGTGVDIKEFNGITWMSEKPGLANEYAFMRDHFGGSGNVMPLIAKAESIFNADKMPKAVTVDQFFSRLTDQVYESGRELSGEAWEKLDTIRQNLKKAARREESGPHYSRQDFWYQTGDYFGNENKNAIKEALEIAGFDSIEMTEEGHKTIGIISPKNIRSKFAAFDPAQADSSQIMFQAGEPSFARQMDPWEAPIKPIKEVVKARWDKWMRAKGSMPDLVFRRKIMRDSRIGADELHVRHLMADFDRVVKKSFGKSFNSLTDQQKEMLNDYLAGQNAIVSPEIENVMRPMRDYLDRLSTMMITEGVIENPETIQKVLDNLGSYLNRSYRAFDDANWKPSNEVRKAAYEYIESEMLDNGDLDGLTPQEIADKVNGQINKILQEGTAADHMAALISESKLGKKDLSMLIKRKKIVKEIRDLLGEYRDPRVNFVRSATKMERAVVNQIFLKSIKADGMGVFLFPEPTGEYAVRIEMDQDKTMSPLSGLYTTPEIRDSFVDALDKEQMANWFRWVIGINGLVKYGKTVLAPTTIARNFMSAAFFGVANGHWFMFNPQATAKAFQTIQQELRNAGGSRAYALKLKKLGVIYDNPYAGEMIGVLKDFTESEAAYAEAAIKGGARKFFDMMTRIYQAGDDFWKIIGFEIEAHDLQRHGGMSRQQAEARAAERVRDTYPTYSMIGKAVKWVRRFPLVGTFVSFPAEIVRTSANITRYMVEDMKTPGMRKVAAKRLVGMTIAAGMGVAVRALTMAMMGLDDDDDEAVRKLGPPWTRNSDIAYAGYDENGLPEYYDLSFLDPYAYLKKPIYALIRGDDDWEEKLASAIKDVVDPFIGVDILAGAIGEAVYNQKQTGGRVYNPEAGPLDQSMAIANHMRKAIQPGAFSNLERIVAAAKGDVSRYGKQYKTKDELMALVGFRSNTLNPLQALSFQSYKFSNSLRDSTSLLSYPLGGQNKVSDDEIRKAFASMIKARTNAYEDMIDYVDIAVSMKLPKSTVFNLLDASGLSKKDAAAVLAGQIPEWRPSRVFMDSARDRAMQTAVSDDRRKELRLEFSRRVRLVHQLAAEEARRARKDQP